MKSYKKHMAKFLITALAAGLLAGCGKSSGTAGGELSGTEGTTAQTDIPALPPEESGGDSQRTGAAGRYMQSVISFAKFQVKIKTMKLCVCMSVNAVCCV